MVTLVACFIAGFVLVQNGHAMTTFLGLSSIGFAAVAVGFAVTALPWLRWATNPDP